MSGTIAVAGRRRRPTARRSPAAGARRRETAVGPPNESTTANAWPVSRSALSPAIGDDVAEAVDGAERAAVGRVVAAHGVDGALRRHDEQLVAAHGEATEHGVALRRRASPTPAACGAASGAAHDAAARRPERRDADERRRRRRRTRTTSSPARRRWRSSTCRRRRSRTWTSICDQPTMTCTSSHAPSGEIVTSATPAGRGAPPTRRGRPPSGSPSTWWWTVRWYWSPGGVAGVGEAGAVGLPRHAARPGRRDGLAAVGAVGGVEHAQDGVLAAGLARADGDERPVG